MEYKEVYESWLANPYFDEATKQELLSIKDDENEIKERFYADLELSLIHIYILRQIMSSVTTDAGMEILQQCGLLTETMQLILEKIEAHVKKRAGSQIEIGIIIFSNVFGMLGQTENVPNLFKKMNAAQHKEE